MNFRNLKIDTLVKFMGTNVDYGFVDYNKGSCTIHLCGNWNNISNLEDIMSNIISHETLDGLVFFRHNEADIHSILNKVGQSRCGASKYTNPSGILYREKARKALGLKKGEVL